MIRLDLVNKNIIREWAMSGIIALIPTTMNLLLISKESELFNSFTANQ